jgi:predicted nucleotidyltransferase
MILRSEQSIAGFKATRIRAALRRLVQDFWTADDVALEMKIDRAAAEELIAALLTSGYVGKAPRKPAGTWRNTIAGNALANSTAAKPIRRETGEDRLAEFLGRVRLLNADDVWAYRVTKVVVFGSYLTDKSRLGDVDVAIRLEPRPKYQDRWSEVLLAQAAEAEKRGTRFSRFVDRLGWAERQAKRFLKSRSRSLSLHDLKREQVLLNRIPHRVLFEEPA